MAETNFDARRFPRVHLRAFAAASVAEKHDIYKENNAICVNISEGGCCLELDFILTGADIDFGIKVAIELPDGKPRLVSDGKIVWLKEESKDMLTKYMIGIEFNNLKPQDKERVRKFVQSQLESKQ